MATSKYISSSNTLKFDDVVGSILSEEVQWKSTSETSISLGSTLNAENKGRKTQRENGPLHDKS